MLRMPLSQLRRAPPVSHVWAALAHFGTLDRVVAREHRRLHIAPLPHWPYFDGRNVRYERAMAIRPFIRATRSGRRTGGVVTEADRHDREAVVLVAELHTRVRRDRPRRRVQANPFN